MKIAMVSLLALILVTANPLPAQQAVAPDTLAYYLATNTVAHAAGHSGDDDDLKLVSGWNYRDYDYTNFALLTNVTWSAKFWLAGVKGLTATPIGISNNLAAQTLITMVSPRHYLRCHHMGILRNTIAFLDTNNVIYYRHPLEQVEVGMDTDVGILNAEVPPSVGFLPVLPTNFADYFPDDILVQGIAMDQSMLVFSQPMVVRSPYIIWSSSFTPANGLPKQWNVAIRGGDSSDPDMLLITNQLVLVSHNYFVSGGPNYGSQVDAINAKMHYLSTNNAAGSDYQLTQYSLTNWPTIR